MMCVRIFVRLLAKICAHLCTFLKNFDVRIFVRLLAKICAHFCAPFSQNMCTFVRFLKIFDVRIFVRLLAKICAHLSLELLDTLVCAYAHIGAQLKVKWRIEIFLQKKLKSF